MKTLLIFGAVHSLLFGLFHCMFWTKLHWGEELKKISPTNSAVMQILNLRLIYVFFLHSFLCFFYADALLFTPMGNFILIISALFWVGRAIEQFVYLKQLPFKNKINIVLTIMFIVGIAIYSTPLFVFH